MNFEHMKKSHIQKERQFYAIGVIAVVAGFSYFWAVKHYDYGIVAFVLGVLLIGAISILAVRKLDIRTKCGVCNFDLSDVLHLVLEPDVLFCPKCGNKM